MNSNESPTSFAIGSAAWARTGEPVENYLQTAEEVLAALTVRADRGLLPAEVEQRQRAVGYNELIERGAKGAWRILWEQLTAVMVVILIVAAVVSGLVGDLKDAIAILAIVVLYTLLGFSQEYRAEQAMAALKKLSVPMVRVRRNGQVQEMSARELVPGDILLLEAGNLIPADARLLEAANLRIQEATLTGESEPVEKKIAPMTGENLPLGDRRNMAYMGTIITYGRGLAVVTHTGMNTELGKIADLIQSAGHEQTPLQRRLDQLGKQLAVVALVVAALVFILGILRAEDVRLMFMTAVSVAVAAVPEGLPAVVTITLALGARRMLQRNALIRKLPAVETLGSVTVICSDKTGTLTENRMTVTVLDVAGRQLDLDETMRQHAPALGAEDQHAIWLKEQPALALLLTGGALCNDALLKPDPQAGRFHSLGDPTEGALLVAAAQTGLWKDQLDQTFPRIAEVPFDSERKRMTTVHQVRLPTEERSDGDGLALISAQVSRHPVVAFTKGSVDGLLEISQAVWVNGAQEPLDEQWRSRVAAANQRLAQQGMRVLGVAWKPLEAAPRDDEMAAMEQGLIFIGLVGMMDPPRAEVKAAVETCKQAGIRPVMITGDHPLTAQEIARQLGISDSGPILTGQELERMTATELRARVEDVSVYARVSPEHKLRIISALQERGHIVAMTGDGVNDAPALKRADIGVAMGITGTDVSKEAADVVLRDDNFATIVAAVEEGRVIYDNVRKFIKFSIAGNLGKILTIMVGPLLGMPLPLLPLQLLWLNLLTDGLLGLGLGLEPAERKTMRRPPYSPRESVLGRGGLRHILWLGTFIGVLALGLGYRTWQAGIANWQTLVFTTLALAQVAQALAIRSGQDSLFQVGLLSNKPLLAATFVTLLLQVGVIYLPFLQGFFGTQPLTAAELALSLALSSLVFVLVEVEKWLLRRRTG